MKKQIKKLILNKRTISNLDTTEMIRHLSGVAPTNGNGCQTNTCYTDRCTRRHTCGLGFTCDI